MHHFCSSIRGCSFFLPRNRRCRRLLSFSPGPPVLPLVTAATPSPGGGRVRLRSTAGVRGVPAAILGTCMLCAVYTTINVQQQQQQQQTTMTTKEEKKNTTSVEHRWTSSGIGPTHKTRMLTTQCEKDNNTNNTNNRRNVDDDVDRNNPDHRPLFFELTEKIGSELRNLQGMANTLTTTTTKPPRQTDATEDDDDNDDDNDHESIVSEEENTYQHILKNMVQNLLLPGYSHTRNNTNNGTNAALDNFFQELQTMSRGGRELRSDTNNNIQDDIATILKVFDIAQDCQTMLGSTMTEFFGSKEAIPSLYVTNLLGYIEKEDELKNPSWKRRKHMFYRKIVDDRQFVQELHEQLQLTDLAYADTREEIRQCLDEKYDAELVYCSMDSSFPNQPAHYIAVKRDQAAARSSSSSSPLEIFLVVRGTKDLTDVITNLLCETQPYRNGSAHAGILTSGQWIAAQHTELFDKMRILANTQTIKLTVLGHSLGAGAAAIAGIELNDNPFIDVKVVGFGCPALLSESLSTSYEHMITTVVGDNDCVPRMSMATMVNALIDISEHDYTPFALRDLKETVNAIQLFLPSLVDDTVKDRILTHLSSLLPDPASFPKHDKRMEVVLFPPGRCIHFYGDGFGIGGSVVPCTFFDELDINRRMLHDHLIQSGYQKIFLDLMR